MFFQREYSRRERDELVLAALNTARGSGEWVKTHCPFCSTGRKSPSFAISRTHGGFKCHRCSISGMLKDFEEDAEIIEQPKSAMQLPDEFLSLSEEPGKSAFSTSAARAYLAWRNISPSVIKQAHVGACVEGRYRGRIVVPVLSARGILLGWVSRAWSKKVQKKYLYPVGSWRASALFNEAALLVETDVPLFIVEGVFDALALWPNAVAVLGKPSVIQENMLALSNRPLVSVLDGDAWREGEALSLRLRLTGATVGAIRLPPKIDPDEVYREDLMMAGIESLSMMEAVAF